MLPALDNLNFVEEVVSFLTAQFTLYKTDIIEVLLFEFHKSVIFKVDIDYLIPANTVFNQFLHPAIKHG